MAAATVAAAAAASSQNALSDSLSTLQASLRPLQLRKSSQDSGKFAQSQSLSLITPANPLSLSFLVPVFT